MSNGICCTRRKNLETREILLMCVCVLKARVSQRLIRVKNIGASPVRVLLHVHSRSIADGGKSRHKNN